MTPGVVRGVRLAVDEGRVATKRPSAVPFGRDGLQHITQPTTKEGRSRIRGYTARNTPLFLVRRPMSMEVR